MPNANDLNQPKAGGLDTLLYVSPMVGPIGVLPGPTVPGGKGKLSKEAAMNKARKAYDNAKARCKAAGPASTPQFLFESFDDFLAAVKGPPPRGDLSLDRIDPCGHYEHCNVRWANKSVQSANKKGFKHGTKPTLSDIQISFQHEEEAAARRRQTTRAWHQVVRLYGGKEGLETVSDGLILARLREAFKGQAAPRRRGPAYFPDLYRLPSLMRCGQVIRLISRPRFVVGQREKLDQSISAALGTFTTHDACFDLNIPGDALEFVFKDVKVGEKGGALWTLSDRPYLKDPAGPLDLETVLVAIGWHLNERTSVAVTPVLTALAEMKFEHGSLELSSRLEQPVLIIPDFLVGGELGWKLTDRQIWQLIKLIEVRRDMKRPTIIGVENVQQLRRDMQRSLLGLLNVRTLESKVHHPPGLLIELATENALALARWERAQEMNKHLEY